MKRRAIGRAKGIVRLVSAGLVLGCLALTSAGCRNAQNAVANVDSNHAPGPDDPGNVVPQKPAAAIPSFAVLQSCAKPQPGGETSLSTVVSIQLCLEVIGAREGTAIAMELRTPQGSPYQRKDFTLNGDPNTAQRIDFSLPTAGTLIDSSRITGRWTATFFANGEPVAEEQFDLTP